jgi:rubrerythrin
MRVIKQKREVLELNMLSTIPSSISKLSKREVDLEILRIGIIAELDAINLYEQLAASTENEDVKKVFLEIAKEEKTHFGEFQALLLRLDKEQVKELEKGKKEVEELTSR